VKANGKISGGKRKRTGKNTTSRKRRKLASDDSDIPNHSHSDEGIGEDNAHTGSDNEDRGNDQPDADSNWQWKYGEVAQNINHSHQMDSPMFKEESEDQNDETD
jgi:hypothetical protein